jgi:predicted dithiol-disulfide oxidoreductase (DUF899 family)
MARLRVERGDSLRHSKDDLDIPLRDPTVHITPGKVRRIREMFEQETERVRVMQELMKQRRATPTTKLYTFRHATPQGNTSIHYSEKFSTVATTNLFKERSNLTPQSNTIYRLLLRPIHSYL